MPPRAASDAGSSCGEQESLACEPLPKARGIKQAHDAGRSVWTLPRSGDTLQFLSGVDGLAQIAWARLNPRRAWPAMPPSSGSAPYVLGWDDGA